MIFITGPLFAGKEEWICERLGWDETSFRQNAVRDVETLAGEAEDLEALADQLAEKAVVIATEIGGGIVPVDRKERHDREAAGRLACLLAERADTVLRICCGLPQLLKGSMP